MLYLLLIILLIILAFLLYTKLCKKIINIVIVGGSDLEKMISNRTKNPSYLNQMISIMSKNSEKYGNKPCNSANIENITKNLNEFLDKQGIEKLSNNTDPKLFIKRYLKYKKMQNYKPLIDLESIRSIKID